MIKIEIYLSQKEGVNLWETPQILEVKNERVWESTFEDIRISIDNQTETHKLDVGNYEMTVLWVEGEDHGIAQEEGHWEMSKYKCLNKKKETFICSSCNQEWEIGFRYKKGFTPIIDEGGFEAEEMDYYETCGNCDSSAVAGIVTSSNVSETPDLPF